MNADKFGDVVTAMKTVSGSLLRMNTAAERHNRKWNYDPDRMQTTEDILESVAAHASADTIRALEDIEAELPTFADRYEQLEVAFNACFDGTPPDHTWEPRMPQMMRDDLWRLRETLVHLTTNSRERAEQAAADRQDPSDAHFARTAATAARVNEAIVDVADRMTLRLRRMVARLDDTYGTSGEPL